MNTLLEKAFHKAVTLPDAKQGELASALLSIIAGMELPNTNEEQLLTENGLTTDQEDEILRLSNQAEEADPISSEAFLQELKVIANAD
ncbi:MAG: hypothetical protein HQL69_02660 [Magnetococcales bacterium]|nr:hypothetical protein [Magnetococcales bacterium]